VFFAVISNADSRSGSRNRRWATTPRLSIGRMRNTRKSPCRHWRIGKRIGRKIRNATCNQSCCQWVFGRRWLPSRNRINAKRPSTPMSPTCTLFGMPPRAMTAQFSNSNGRMTRSFSTVHGRSRTTKPRPARQSIRFLAGRKRRAGVWP
jgi:hypothetical protein